MDSRFNKDESEFAVFVSSILLDMLSDVDGLLDKLVKIFRESWGNSVDLQDSENLRTSDALNLRNTVLISEEDTNLRW